MSEQKKERFVCNRYPSLIMGVGNKALQFVDGAFETADPEEIKAIQGCSEFRRYIIPDNPKLKPKKDRIVTAQDVQEDKQEPPATKTGTVSTKDLK